jgi:excisionase family DNA binding protein
MKELTTSQAADRLGVGKSTVNLWCRRGFFPNARSEETPRGPVWLIPESDLEGFEPPKMGRPPKPETERASIKKAISRWEGEGGAILPKSNAGRTNGKGNVKSRKKGSKK